MKYMAKIFLYYGYKGIISLFFPMYFTQVVGSPDIVTFKETNHFYFRGLWYQNEHRGSCVDDLGLARKLF